MSHLQNITCAQDNLNKSPDTLQTLLATKAKSCSPTANNCKSRAIATIRKHSCPTGRVPAGHLHETWAVRGAGFRFLWKPSTPNSGFLGAE